MKGRTPPPRTLERHLGRPDRTPNVRDETAHAPVSYPRAASRTFEPDIERPTYEMKRRTPPPRTLERHPVRSSRISQISSYHVRDVTAYAAASYSRAASRTWELTVGRPLDVRDETVHTPASYPRAAFWTFEPDFANLDHVTAYAAASYSRAASRTWELTVGRPLDVRDETVHTPASYPRAAFWTFEPDFANIDHVTAYAAASYSRAASRTWELTVGRPLDVRDETVHTPASYPRAAFWTFEPDFANIDHTRWKGARLRLVPSSGISYVRAMFRKYRLTTCETLRRTLLSRTHERRLARGSSSSADWLTCEMGRYTPPPRTFKRHLGPSSDE
ncbi:hypothetical protein FRC06_005544 [Ceratobasidium sp. 370]|nr:hypothetical protein FRC06_005544 [Ceratobasidium sp. 370]